MKVDLKTYENVHEPVYVLEEDRLRNNLSLIDNVAKTAGVEIILAFKAFALWKTFPVFKEYIKATTASSLYEAKLGFNRFGAPVHTFSPAYTDDTISEIASCSSHLVFNSMSQYYRFHDAVHKSNDKASIGIRINPEYSEVETELYNPCAPGSRFGVLDTQLPEILPEDIEGFHCHTLCESGADVFMRTLVHIESHFSKWMDQLKWINFGGGHPMTRKDYDIKLLVDVFKDFKKRHPNLKVILEPGSAFGWQTGPLVSQVVDIVENYGIRTAILNVSFTCHMPDCLEMPYHPAVRGAKTLAETPENVKENFKKQHVYRLGGCSCLSGDYMGDWQFDHELSVGENVIFEDMLHYTTVKTNMFNGISHPSIAIATHDGELKVLRRYSYDDYENRMD